MKTLVAVALMVLSSLTYAVTVDLKGLTPEQQDSIVKAANEMRGSRPNVSAVVRGEVEAWGELGGKVGQAMVGAAKELGIAAAEFSKTDLGKVVTVIVIYKLIGRDIIRIITGFAVAILGTLACIWAMRTPVFYDEVTYKYVPTFFGMFNRRRVERFQDGPTGGATACRMITLAGFTILTAATSLNILL